MNQFLLSEKFKLEIRWQDVVYEQDGKCKLIGAYFTGPVIQIAQKINPNDYIVLDFYSQYIQLVKSVYMAKLVWGAVSYSDDGQKVYFTDAVLEHDKELNNVPKLNVSDYFVVDTQDHVSDKHSQFLVYKTYLINENHILYRFEK